MAVVIKIKVKIPQWLDKFFTCPLLTYRLLRYGYPFRRIRLTDLPAHLSSNGFVGDASNRQGSGVLSSVAIAKEEAKAKEEGKFTIVDPADFYRLNSFYWLTCGKNGNLYAARLIRTPTGRLNTILMHRQIFFNCSPDQLSNFSRSGLVDHKNTNSLDNRRTNLRLATPSQNSCNSRRDKSNTYSRFRGVSFSKRKGKWFAAIRANGRKLWLGYFSDELSAAKAYDRAAIQYHADFARLNFSRDEYTNDIRPS